MLLMDGVHHLVDPSVAAHRQQLLVGLWLAFLRLLRPPLSVPKESARLGDRARSSSASSSCSRCCCCRLVRSACCWLVRWMLFKPCSSAASRSPARGRTSGMTARGWLTRLVWTRLTRRWFLTSNSSLAAAEIWLQWTSAIFPDGT